MSYICHTEIFFLSYNKSPDPAAFAGGAAHGVQRQQRRYLPCCKLLAPLAAQRASRRGAPGRLGARPGLPPGHTSHYADDLLQAAGPAPAVVRPAGQLAVGLLAHAPWG